jgi:hypothetical protein
MEDEILKEILFAEITENPARDLEIYIIQCNILKSLKPNGW